MAIMKFFFCTLILLFCFSGYTCPFHGDGGYGFETYDVYDPLKKKKSLSFYSGTQGQSHKRFETPEPRTEQAKKRTPVFFDVKKTKKKQKKSFLKKKSEKKK